MNQSMAWESELTLHNYSTSDEVFKDSIIKVSTLHNSFIEIASKTLNDTNWAMIMDS